MKINQTQLIFFDEKDGDIPPTTEKKNAIIEKHFQHFIGNEKALTKLKTAAFTALSRPNHQMPELSFSIFGPPSSGKTTLARIYAKTVSLPYVELSPQAVKDNKTIFEAMKKACEKRKIELVPQEDGSFFLPPMVVFVDEVHNLNKTVTQGLLKAIEHEDRMFHAEDGIVADTKLLTWFVATTDEGMLFDAFRTRFSPVYLKYLKQEEIAQIVLAKHPEFSEEICQRIAFFNSRIPRKALEFARYVEMYKFMRNDLELAEVVEKVAEEEGIDKFGMHEIHWKVLLALKDGPIAKSRISHVTGRKKEENERYIMPWLLTDVEDQPALVRVSTKGYILTNEGQKEVARRSKVISVPRGEDDGSGKLANHSA